MCGGYVCYAMYRKRMRQTVSGRNIIRQCVADNEWHSVFFFLHNFWARHVDDMWMMPRRSFETNCLNLNYVQSVWTITVAGNAVRRMYITGWTGGTDDKVNVSTTIGIYSLQDMAFKDLYKKIISNEHLGDIHYYYYDTRYIQLSFNVNFVWKACLSTFFREQGINKFYKYEYWKKQCSRIFREHWIIKFTIYHI